MVTNLHITHLRGRRDLGVVATTILPSADTHYMQPSPTCKRRIRITCKQALPASVGYELHASKLRLTQGSSTVARSRCLTTKASSCFETCSGRLSRPQFASERTLPSRGPETGDRSPETGDRSCHLGADHVHAIPVVRCQQCDRPRNR